MSSNDMRLSKILSLHSNVQNIRNISIIAHVDHGKTTLSDALISSNNIISKRLVGKLRYLDSRPDEQERQITMKSSSISLVYKDVELDSEFLINLIDSPGHVEFSSEVSSALRLTDGALILIDVLEGVSAQTYTVIKQAFEEKVRSVLILNKIDRLFNELDMNADAVYKHLSIIIDQVNAILSGLISTDLQKSSEINPEDPEFVSLTSADVSSKLHAAPSNPSMNSNATEGISLEEDLLETYENQLYFAPEKGNIIFCSAMDCWAFRLNDFARIFAKKLNCNEKAIGKFLWGDFYLNPKSKRVYDKPQSKGQNPIFVDFVMQNIWNIYDKVKSKDEPKVLSIFKSLQIDPPPSISSLLQRDPQKVLLFLMNKWLPIETTILQTAIRLLPSPPIAQKSRLEQLSRKLFKVKLKIKKEEEFHIEGGAEKIDISLNEEVKEEKKYDELYQLKESVSGCEGGEDKPVVIFISKMIAVPKESINERGLNEYPTKNPVKFIGFGRVFSGVLKRGTKIFVISPKAKKSTYESDKQKTIDYHDNHIQEIIIQNIYVMMGQFMEGVTKISAGNTVGIGNLDEIVFKTATLSTSVHCPSFTPMSFRSSSLLKVSLKTEKLEDFPFLVEGLKKLNKSDPSLDIYSQENGDLILSTCGEVHLERCIRDLEDVLAKVKIKVSEPLISFREGAIYKKWKRKRRIKKEEGKREEEEELEEEEEEKKDGEIINIMEEKPESTEMRFFEENRVKKQEQKEAFRKQVTSMPKNIDKKNKAKNIAKVTKFNLSEVKKRSNPVQLLIPSRKLQLKVLCFGLPFEFACFLEKNSNLLRKLFYDEGRLLQNTEVLNFLMHLHEKMGEMLDKDLIELMNKNLICFGPKKCGPNMLFMKGINEEETVFSRLEKRIGERKIENEKGDLEKNGELELSVKKVEERGMLTTSKLTRAEILTSLINGFDLAVLAGPLCEEPMMGVCFFIEEIKDMNEEIPKNEETKEEAGTISMVKDSYGPLTGQLMSTMKDACLESYLGANPRLIEGVYKCYIQTESTFYGKTFDLLNKRRATILEENLNENSNYFNITAQLPVQESIGFYTEMMIKTSGRSNAQLFFDTWKIVEVDPFFAPETEEELEEFGEQAQLSNLAKQMIDKTRRRKGILTEEKIVIAAEKQRTLSKKK